MIMMVVPVPSLNPGHRDNGHGYTSCWLVISDVTGKGQRFFVL